MHLSRQPIEDINDRSRNTEIVFSQQHFLEAWSYGKSAPVGTIVRYRIYTQEGVGTAEYIKTHWGTWQHKTSHISAEVGYPVSDTPNIRGKNGKCYLDNNEQLEIMDIHFVLPLTADESWYNPIKQTHSKTQSAVWNTLENKTHEHEAHHTHDIPEEVPGQEADDWVPWTFDTESSEGIDPDIEAAQEYEETPIDTQDEPLHEAVFEFSDTRVIRSNISEVKKSFYDIAMARAEERLRDEHARAGIFKKMGRIFTRAKLREKYFAEEMQKLESEQIFHEETRHIRENVASRFGKNQDIFHNNAVYSALNLSDAEKQALEADLQNNVISQEEYNEKISTFSLDAINNISTLLVQWEIDEYKFIREFEAILHTQKMQEYTQNISHKGTDLLKHLQVHIAFHEFLKNLPEDAGQIQELLLLHSHMQDYFASIFGENYQNNIEKIAQFLEKSENREPILNQKIIVKMEVLSGGEAAFAIDNTDKTDEATYRIGKWLQKHPIISSGLTAVGISASSIAAGPMGNILSGMFGIGGINASRRYSEYTDEHAGFEKRITQWTHKNAEIYQNIERIHADLQSASGLKRMWLSHKLKKAQKKWELYQQRGKEIEGMKTRKGTTHRHIAPIVSLNNKLEAYIFETEGFELDTPEKREYCKRWTMQGLARLDAWQQTGHNFLKSRDEKGMEENFDTLYQNILYTSKKLDISLDELRQDEVYTRTLGKLVEEYNEASQNFKNARTATSLKRGVFAGGLYGVSSGLFQWLSNTGFFYEPKSVTTTTTQVVSPAQTIPASVHIDANIAQDLQNVLGAQKYQEFLDHISHSTNPETLWQTLVDDILQDKTLGNNVKNQIMTFVLNATDIENGITKPELLIEAGKMGLFHDIANNSSSIDRVMNLLHKWGYAGTSKQWFVDTVQAMNNGTLSIASLTPAEQTRIAEGLWTYVHRNGQWAGSPLWQVFMDSIDEKIIPAVTKIVTHTEQIPSTWLEKIGMFGIPTWKNTFLSRLKTIKQDQEVYQNKTDTTWEWAPQAHQTETSHKHSA